MTLLQFSQKPRPQGRGCSRGQRLGNSSHEHLDAEPKAFLEELVVLAGSVCERMQSSVLPWLFLVLEG
jgi:hypothetical protein